MLDIQGYCIRCNRMRQMERVKVEVSEGSGRKYVRGVCAKCGTVVTRVVEEEKSPILEALRGEGGVGNATE